MNNEPDTRDFLLNTLTPCAGQVLVASSADAAKRLMQRHRFDLVMLDSALPDNGGLALLQDMRRQGGHCEVALLSPTDLQTQEKRHILAVLGSVGGRQKPGGAAAGQLAAHAGAPVRAVGCELQCGHPAPGYRCHPPSGCSAALGRPGAG